MILCGQAGVWIPGSDGVIDVKRTADAKMVTVFAGDSDVQERESGPREDNKGN
jgi:hypothetical protein